MRRRNNKKSRKRDFVPEIKETKEDKELWIRDIQPKGQRQGQYIEAIYSKDIVFCFGPAGTGKTFLACNIAAKFLVEGRIDHVILCRPAVEAGENLGYLPGSLEEKLNPYLRPLYDALNYMLGAKSVNEMIGDKIVEVVPLAYMRGRTLNNAFVILDEAQNTTPDQMKMFLTRMGEYSKFVVNGDITQSDLEGKKSGLMDAKELLTKIDGVAWIEMTKQDIVRHPIVQKIVEAYEARTPPEKL